MGRVWPVHSGNSLIETRWQMEGTKKNDRGDRGDVLEQVYVTQPGDTEVRLARAMTVQLVWIHPLAKTTLEKPQRTFSLI